MTYPLPFSSSSVASRTFCSSFPMPPNPQVSASEIPVLTDSSNKRSSRAAWNENRLRQGYDRDLVEHHLDLVQVGQAPTTQDQNVERSRTSIVGPPPNTNAEGKKETGPRLIQRTRSTGKARTSEIGQIEPQSGQWLWIRIFQQANQHH